MKLGFIFDTNFKEYKGDYFSVNLSLDVWKSRYLKHFDNIVVVGRKTKHKSKLDSKFVKSNSKRVNFKCIGNTSRFKRIFNYCDEKKFIKESIKDCDFIVCRGTWGVKACKELGKPYLIEVVSCIWDSMWNYSILGKIVSVPLFFKTKFDIYNAQNVVYVTKDFLQKRYPTKGNNIGVSDVWLSDNNEKEIEKAYLKKVEKYKNKEKIILGTAAALNVKYKGQKYVIKALYDLKRKGYDNFEYQLVGSGDTSRLKSLINKLDMNDSVKIIGPVKHTYIYDWYDSLDIYIQPSLQEGLPRTVIEAMSRGLICIGSNTGGIPELIDDKFIYSKYSLRKSHKISKILLNINEKNVLEDSKKNFCQSKRFQRRNLDKMYNDFLNDCV